MKEIDHRFIFHDVFRKMLPECVQEKIEKKYYLKDD